MITQQFSPTTGSMTSANVMTAVSQSQKAMHKLLATCLGHHGLSVAQWTLLSNLAEAPQTPSSLAKNLDIKSAYVALLTRQLRDVGDLVEQVGMPDDTRSKTLGLTDLGKQFVVEVEAKLQVCLQRELVSPIAARDLATYFAVSTFIAKNVKHAG